VGAACQQQQSKCILFQEKEKKKGKKNKNAHLWLIIDSYGYCEQVASLFQ